MPEKFDDSDTFSIPFTM